MVLALLLSGGVRNFYLYERNLSNGKDSPLRWETFHGLGGRVGGVECSGTVGMFEIVIIGKVLS